MVAVLSLDVKLADQRDFDFAKKYKLDIIKVVPDGSNKELSEAFTGSGKIIIHF